MANSCLTNTDRLHRYRSAATYRTLVGEARRASTTKIASGGVSLPTLLVFFLLLVSTQSVFAERFNFDLFTLPTDLVADIVNIEDDIALDNRQQSNRNAGVKAVRGAETSAIVKSEGVVGEVNKSSSSIFSNVDTEEVVADNQNASEVSTSEATTKLIADTEVALNTKAPSSGSIFSDIDSEGVDDSEKSIAVVESETVVAQNAMTAPLSSSIFSEVDSGEASLSGKPISETVSETSLALNAEVAQVSGSVMNETGSGEVSESDTAGSELEAEAAVAQNAEIGSSSNSVFSDVAQLEPDEVGTSDSSPESETTVTANIKAESTTDSVFGAVDAENTETDPAVLDSISETIIATATKEISEEKGIDNAASDTPEKVATISAYSPAVTVIPEIADVIVASTDTKYQPSATVSDGENSQSEPESMPILVVEQPVSAGDAADMPRVLDESQGVIIVADSSTTVDPEEAEAEAVIANLNGEVESASTETDATTIEEPSTVVSETLVEAETEVLAAAETVSESASAILSEPDQATEKPLISESKTEIASNVQSETTSTAKTALTDEQIIELAQSIETETAALAVTPEQEVSINEDEIIIAWATAWSNNQTEDYLAFYADTFQPADQNLSRDAWEKLRRKRLQNKNIRIIVSNAEVYRVQGDIVEVRFTQRYTSSSYKDRVIKSIEMTETEKGWQFLSERTIEELPFE